MFRRTFIKNSIILAAPAIISPKAVLAHHSDEAGGVLLDCGDPNSALCREEFRVRQQQAERYAKWEKDLPNLAASVHSRFKRDFPEFFVANKDGKPKILWSTKVLGASEDQLMNFLVKPLPDFNGQIEDSATIRIYRKKALGGTKTIANSVSCYGRFKANGARSLRVNRFSTDCVVMYSRKPYNVFGDNLRKDIDPSTCRA